eukprot:6189217-Pleurochrysis_carterae.AAC.5
MAGGGVARSCAHVSGPRHSQIRPRHSQIRHTKFSALASDPSTGEVSSTLARWFSTASVNLQVRTRGGVHVRTHKPAACACACASASAGACAGACAGGYLSGYIRHRMRGRVQV